MSIFAVVHFAAANLASDTAQRTSGLS